MSMASASDSVQRKEGPGQPHACLLRASAGDGSQALGDRCSLHFALRTNKEDNPYGYETAKSWWKGDCLVNQGFPLSPCGR